MCLPARASELTPKRYPRSQGYNIVNNGSTYINHSTERSIKAVGCFLQPQYSVFTTILQIDFKQVCEKPSHCLGGLSRCRETSTNIHLLISSEK